MHRLARTRNWPTIEKAPWSVRPLFESQHPQPPMQARESKYFRFPFWEVVSNIATQLHQKAVDVAWSGSCYTSTGNTSVGNGLQTGTSDILNARRTAIGRQSTLLSSATVRRHQEYITSEQKTRNDTKTKNALPVKPNPAVRSSTLPFFLFGKPLVQISASILYCLHVVLVCWGLEASYCFYSYSRLVYDYPDWGFSVFFLSCKANARVKPARMGHGPHSI